MLDKINSKRIKLSYMSNKNNKIYETIGNKIKQLREAVNLSQDDLASKIGIAPNTISRWETTKYKPKIDDLQKLAVFFNVNLSAFLPDEYQTGDSPEISALMSAASELNPDDIKELVRYAEFRKVRKVLESNKIDTGEIKNDKRK